MSRPGNGWTGGQYSGYRILLAAVLLVLFAGLAQGQPPIGRWCWIVAAGLCVPLGIGRLDRLAAPLLAAACLTAHARLSPALGWHLLAGVLILHALIPGSPYGAWTARGRPDPSGGWCMPEWIYTTAWAGLVIGYTVDGALLFWGLGVDLLGSWRYSLAAFSHYLPAVARPLLAWPLCSLEIALPVLVVFPRARRWVWWALAVSLPLRYAGVGALPTEFNTGLLMLQLFAIDPAWIGAQSAGPETERTEWVFYDGDCGLCHRAVRFLLAEDPAGRRFRYAPLQGAVFVSTVPEPLRRELPDSMAVRTIDGRLLTQASAVLYCGRRLGGLWRVLASLALLVPRPLRDGIYRRIAAVRHRLFRRPAQVCPVLTTELRARFADLPTATPAGRPGTARTSRRCR